MRKPVGRLYALLVAASAAACGRPDDQRTGSVEAAVFQESRSEWPEGVSALVDSGNVAYRQQNYERAAQYYREAAELGPGVAAAWFGIFMVERARGNMAAADSALERVRSIQPGASLVVPPADTSR